MSAYEKKVLFTPQDNNEQSDTFFVGHGKQITVFAFGLAPDEYISFEIIFSPAVRKDLCICPPLKAQMPSVADAVPLSCCGQEVRLTSTNGFVIIDAPQNVDMRAVLHAKDRAGIYAWASDSNTSYVTDRMRGCPCEG